MGTVSRKAIAWSLINLLNGQGPVPNSIGSPVNPIFPTAGRRLPDPNALSGGQFPGLFVIKPSEHWTYDGEGETVPPTQVIDFLAVIYTDYSQQVNAVPADGIDDLFDGIVTALAPGVLDQWGNGGRQTLGGIVQNCIITGEPKFAPGDAEGKGETIIPISVTLNQYP